MNARMTAAQAATELRRQAMRGVGLVTACALLIAVGGCVPGYVKDNDSPVLFRIADINGGSSILSDVGTSGPTETAVTIAVRPKNPLNSNVPQVAEAVFLEQYRVRYFRTDGRDVEGVDVPYSFSAALATAVDIGVDSGANVTLTIPLVRAQAKQEPPLRNLQTLLNGNTTIGANGGVITPRVTMIAELTVFGRTVAREQVSDTRRATVDFVDAP
jgi:hypothetical protein